MPNPPGSAELRFVLRLFHSPKLCKPVICIQPDVFARGAPPICFWSDPGYADDCSATPEAAWLPTLLALADWEPPLVPTIVLAPHPDDETLGAGGLVAKLCRAAVPVTIVAITDGEGAYPDTPHLGEIRALEQTEALCCLGVPRSRIHRLHLPDRHISRYEKELADQLLPLVTGHMHLVAPWQRDFHPDHEAAGRAAARVAQLNDLTITYYLFWTWHRGSRACLTGLGSRNLHSATRS